MRRLAATVLLTCLVLLNAAGCTMIADAAMDPEDPGLNPFDNFPRDRSGSDPIDRPTTRSSENA